MKTLLGATLAIVIPAFFSLRAAQNPTPPAPSTAIAFVSAQRLTTESVPGKADVARLQALQQQRAAGLRTRQQTLDATREQLSRTADAAERNKLQQQEQVQRADLESATSKAQTDIQTLQRQVTAELQGRVKAVLEELTRARNLRLVLNSDTSVVWGAADMDLTADVIERLNAAAAAAPKAAKN